MGRHASSTYLVRVSDLRAGEPEYRLLERGKSGYRSFRGHEILTIAGDADPPAYSYILGDPTPLDRLPSAESLACLGRAMLSEARSDSDSNIPVGYTYLGQFIFHDISYMHEESTRRVIEGISEVPENLNTPALDLDSVLSNESIDNDSMGFASSRFKLNGTKMTAAALPEDLPRSGCGRPLIADDRNDDFLPLAQSHMLMCKFYNAVSDWLGYECAPFGDPNSKAAWLAWVRRTWVQHFQSVVLHDYLPRVIDSEVYQDVLRNGRCLIGLQDCVQGGGSERSWLPLEFPAAAGRFGHSMVRGGYLSWNSKQTWRPVHVGHFLDLSYLNSGDYLEKHGHGLPLDWVTNWFGFFDLSPRFSSFPLQAPMMANRIGPQLACHLRDLPQCMHDPAGCNQERPIRDCSREENAATAEGDPTGFNLASTTLRRGRDLQLAGAQQIISKIKKDSCCRAIKGLSPSQVTRGRNCEVKAAFKSDPTLVTNTPLWYYILQEAEVLGSRHRLGPLGSRLVMETVHAAIEKSPNSILNPAWRCILPSTQAEAFTMADLIAFSANPNPRQLLV
jgi:hypothetical protein